MANDITITVTGNLTADPELRYTTTGAAVARFTVASTPRHRDQDTGQWRDGEPVFLTCTAWRELAENTAETLAKGTRVIVTGRLRQRSYDTSTGDKRTATELHVDEVGPSLRFTAATLRRLQRTTTTAGAAEHVPAEPPF